MYYFKHIIPLLTVSYLILLLSSLGLLCCKFPGTRRIPLKDLATVQPSLHYQLYMCFYYCHLIGLCFNLHLLNLINFQTFPIQLTFFRNCGFGIICLFPDIYITYTCSNKCMKK
mgnify:CR=1 FL=1